MEVVLEAVGEWGIIIIGIVLLIVAYAGSILPALPGVPFAAVAVALLHFTLYKYPWWVLIVVILMTLAISIADYYVPIWGTKKFGGSKHGIRGSTYGLIVGLLISFFTSGLGVIALIFGPFVGAYIGEKYGAKADNKTALKSAVGSLIGFLAGTFGKLVVVTIITVIYIIGVVKYL